MVSFLQDMEEKRQKKNYTATDICSLEHSISLMSRKLSTFTHMYIWYVCDSVIERDVKQLKELSKRLINVFSFGINGWKRLGEKGSNFIFR